jgi:hypothetical protein
MKRVMSKEVLKQENLAHAGSGGRSQENRSLGFRPAFLDFATMTIYPSCFRNGSAAPFHLLDGLPDEAVELRGPCGKVITAKATLISGFERNGFFYTRTAAARAVSEWVCFAKD